MKVKCIDNIWKEGALRDCYHIECDDKKCRSYPKYRFELIKGE